MSKVKLSISVDDEHLDKISEVVTKIKKVGLKVDQQLAGLGIITGAIDTEKLDSLREVKGVANVEVDRDTQIAPPDREVQ